MKPRWKSKTSLQFSAFGQRTSILVGISNQLRVIDRPIHEAKFGTAPCHQAFLTSDFLFSQQMNGKCIEELVGEDQAGPRLR